MSTDFPLLCALTTMNRSRFDAGRLNDPLSFIEVLNEYGRFKADQQSYHDAKYGALDQHELSCSSIRVTCDV